jgi:Protein of unknown function (DUF3035)
MMRVGLGFAGGVLMLLSACSSGKPELMNIRSSTDGPDEFSILPPKPLQMPETLAELPVPTPGGFSRTDATPNEDAIIALGGRPGGAGIPAGDSALVSYASRKGVSGNIRTVLAQEDLAFRTDNQGRVLERLLNVNVYFRAYRDYALDQHAELERWRSVGAGNPSAPPALEGE